MEWKPVEVIMQLHPETTRELKGLEPAIAAFCPNCGEVWVVIEKD